MQRGPNCVAWRDARPVLDRLRRLPAQIADRRRGERNALERAHAVVLGSLDDAIGRLDLIGGAHPRARPGQERQGDHTGTITTHHCELHWGIGNLVIGFGNLGDLVIW